MEFDNKLQRYAHEAGITTENQLRVKLREYGVAGGTSYRLWHEGARAERQYDVIKALEEILGVPADRFLEAGGE